ncbi:AIM24 family protein, partial [Mycobacterium tuberculosis]|nr:AIM24 family protein [Mycobacterium tuberculosis]
MGSRGWTPVAEGAGLQAPAPGMPNTPPPVPVAAGARGRADDIEFRIVGHEMQFVELELDPGESAIAEAGALMFKDATVQMDTVFGAAKGDQGGFMGKVMAAGRRVLTGESLFA